MTRLLAALLSVWLAITPALAAVGTVFVDTGGSATNSGTTDSNTAPAGFSGTAAAWTTATATVTLDTNTNLTGLAQDGSQAVYLANSTNTATRIFWISSFTGCTGTGACSLTLLAAGAGTGNNPALPTCTTCTASVWTIGGRYLWPSAATLDLVEGALRPGDTLQFNNTPASKTATVFQARNAGDATTGCINVIGKVGVRPVLQTTNNTVTVNLANIVGYFLSNLEIKNTGGASGNSAVTSLSSGCGIDNVKVSASGTGFSGIVVGAGVGLVTNSEITGTGGAGVSTAAASVSMSGNYIHDLTGDCFATSLNGAINVIENNILSSCGGRGINLTASSSTLGNRTLAIGNTIYNNTLAGLEVVNANTVVVLRNNIIANTNTANIVLWDAGNAQIAGSHGYNLFFSSGGGTLSGLTANSTEITGSDPLFVGAPTNLALSSGSPAIGAGFAGTFPVGGGTTGSRTMGAAQPAAGGGRGIIGGFLLRRDLGHANDNRTAFVSRTAA